MQAVTETPNKAFFPKFSLVGGPGGPEVPCVASPSVIPSAIPATPVLCPQAANSLAIPGRGSRPRAVSANDSETTETHTYDINDCTLASDGDLSVILVESEGYEASLSKGHVWQGTAPSPSRVSRIGNYPCRIVYSTDKKCAKMEKEEEEEADILFTYNQDSLQADLDKSSTSYEQYVLAMAAVPPSAAETVKDQTAPKVEQKIEKAEPAAAETDPTVVSRGRSNSGMSINVVRIWDNRTQNQSKPKSATEPRSQPTPHNPNPTPSQNVHKQTQVTKAIEKETVNSKDKENVQNAKPVVNLKTQNKKPPKVRQLVSQYNRRINDIQVVYTNKNMKKSRTVSRDFAEREGGQGGGRSPLKSPGKKRSASVRPPLGNIRPPKSPRGRGHGSPAAAVPTSYGTHAQTFNQ